MNSSESSYQQGEFMEEDQRNIIMIGGIEIFLPINPVEAREYVAGAATEGKPTYTIKAEKEADNIDFADLYEELEAPKRRVIVQSMHIQHDNLEIDEGAHRPMEQLEGVGVEPTREEIVEVNLLEEEDEQQLSGETTELKSATKWPTSATGDEDNMEVQIDQIGKKEKEYTFQCTPEMEKEEHLEEWLKIFIQGVEQEITVECEPTAEEETTYSIDLVDLCEEMEALERRVKMKKHLIRQVRLEIYGEKMQ
jgi:hypothetical protein